MDTAESAHTLFLAGSNSTLGSILGLAALTLYLLGTLIVIRRLFFRTSISGSQAALASHINAKSCNSETALFNPNKIRLFFNHPKVQLILPGCAAVTLHLLYSGGQLIQLEGLNFGIFPLLSLIGALMILATISISIRHPFENITLIVYPIAALLLLLSITLHSQYQPKGAFSLPILTHITVSLMAYSVLGIAFAQALLLLGQNYQLKHKHFAGMIRVLPPLQLMETILFGLLWIGMALLTLSIGTGLLFFDNFFAQKLAHKTFFTIGAWVILSTLLIGRYRAGWRGITAVKWTIGGFLFLVIGVIGTKFVLEILLAP